MIKILVIASVVLFVLWLFTEMFKKKKKEVINQNNKNKSMLYIVLFIVALILLFIFLPRFGGVAIGILNKFLLPLLSLVKNFIPF